jgi:hypothetical protein
MRKIKIVKKSLQPNIKNLHPSIQSHPAKRKSIVDIPSRLRDCLDDSAPESLGTVRRNKRNLNEYVMGGQWRQQVCRQ